MYTPVKEGHEILVQAPPEYGAEGMVWRLKRSLYGAAKSGATFSRVSETSLHQEQRKHSTRQDMHSTDPCCGKIQYAITCRPDLMYPLKELGRRLSNPRAADRKCLKHLLRDIRGTMDMGDGASSLARLEARPWQHRLPTRTGPDVTRRGSSRVVASSNGAG